jgi:capsular polysaccharide biosynthesis protein
MKKIKKLFQFYYKNFIKILFYIIYEKIYYKPNKKIKDIKIEKVNKKYFNQKKYFIYSIKNGILYTDNVQNVAAISNNLIFGPASFQHGNNRIITPKNNIVLKKGTPSIRKNFSGTVLSLVQGASGENYFHWLFDILPRIKIYSNNLPLNLSLQKIDYFYFPPLKSSQIDSLKLMGINKKKIINSKIYKHIKADKIIFISHPWYTKGKFHDQSFSMPSWIIKWIRLFFIKNKKKFNSSKKILIDRSESAFKHCQIINKKEVNSFLIKRGFKAYKIGKYNFGKQIFMFWNAQCIIGAHGAAFSNLIFCKPKTKIIELKPFNHPGKNYKSISKINRLNYMSINSKKEYLNNKDGDIYVDLKILKKKLDEK